MLLFEGLQGLIVAFGDFIAGHLVLFDEEQKPTLVFLQFSVYLLQIEF